MLTTEFPGCYTLIETINAAVVKDSAQAITDSLCSSLRALIKHNAFTLPGCVFETAVGRYARRELYHSDEYGYCVVAMTWGPGQGAAIHDHSHMWCVEGVWSGVMKEMGYDRLEDKNGVCQFRPTDTIQNRRGSVVGLVPPHEYHALHNPSQDTTAVSLHIYSNRMTYCRSFHPLPGKHGQQGYLCKENSLYLDPIH